MKLSHFYIENRSQQKANPSLTATKLFDFLLQDPFDIDGIGSFCDNLVPEGQQPFDEQPALGRVQRNTFYHHLIFLPLSSGI